MNIKRIIALIFALVFLTVAAVAEEENWLLCDLNAAGEAEYCSFARVGGVEGFELSSVEKGIMDEKLHYYVFKPVAEDAPAQSVSIQTGKGSAAAVAGKLSGQIANFGELLHGSEVETLSVNGMTAHAVVIEYRMASYDEGEEYDYVQNSVVYIETPVAERCVVLNAVNMGHDEAAFGDRAAMQALLIGAAEGIVLAE